jgi:hypothetical protein
MVTYKIKWEAYDLEKALKKGFMLEKNFLWYMIFLQKEEWLGISKKRELVYVGMTCEQTVSERLLNKHEALKSCLREMDGNVIIALGAWGGRKKTIDKKTIKDIEYLMISAFKPRLNGVGVKEYKGIQLSIISESEQDWDELNWEIKFS